MQENRSVFLFKDVLTYLNYKIWCNRPQETIKRCMVQLAECQPVADDQQALRVRVWKDMGCIQEFARTEPTECTLRTVSLQHPLAKGLLMKTNSNLGSYILAAGILRR